MENFCMKILIVGEDKFKIGTELNETIIQKILEENIKTIKIFQKLILYQKDLIYFKPF